MSDTASIFDSRLVRLRRQRAAAAFARHDFLAAEVAGRLVERLDDLKRVFPDALDLGCRNGLLGSRLEGRGGIRTLVHADAAEAFARQAPPPRLVCSDDALPFGAEAFDLVMSCLNLHWVNDLPGTLVQVRRCLKPDGLLLAAMLGGDTLNELRQALMEAEIECEGGASLRVSPLADIRDVGALLQRAGFALPVADADRLLVRYPDPLTLMRELRAMGESNAARERRKNGLRRATLKRACALYRRHFAAADGTVPATFEIIYLTAWAPHETQQKPAPRGSGRIPLGVALGRRGGEREGG